MIALIDVISIILWLVRVLCVRVQPHIRVRRLINVFKVHHVFDIAELSIVLLVVALGCVLPTRLCVGFGLCVSVQHQLTFFSSV